MQDYYLLKLNSLLPYLKIELHKRNHFLELVKVTE